MVTRVNMVQSKYTTKPTRFCLLVYNLSNSSEELKEHVKPETCLIFCICSEVLNSSLSALNVGYQCCNSQMFVRIANKEDPDRTDASGSALFI